MFFNGNGISIKPCSSLEFSLALMHAAADIIAINPIARNAVSRKPNNDI